MIQLTKREPQWRVLREATEDDPAVEVLFAPHGRSIKRRAFKAAQALVPDLPDDLSAADDEALELFAEALARETLRRAILDWRGIGGEDGAPIAVTPETLQMFLDTDELLVAADRAYLVPAAERDAEKNGSPPSPNGISAGAPDTAPDAPFPAGAKPARTPRKPRAPKKAKTSGTS